MAQLDNAPVTERPSTATAPAVDEPRDRGQIALLAIAAAAVATAVVVVLTSGGDESSTAARGDDAVRRPAVTAPATTDPVLPAPSNPTAGAAPTAGTQAPGTASAPGTAAPGAGGSAGLPGGWEPRTFEGVTFAVPPGATGADVVDPGNADAPALFSWNGPSLGGEVHAHVSMWITAADGVPTLGSEYQQITVPGADRAHMWTGQTDGDPASTTVDVHMVAGSRYINLVANVAPGAEGEEIVRRLIASIVIG
jgi:hypothetical protein